ncbi:MAG: hypothetical protein M1497_12190 [Nitrospirae bacterium]|nr:hypothetical protein [Nitrospirota bacterium]
MDRGNRLYGFVFIVLVFAFLVLTTHHAKAVDELYLTGFLNSVDVKSGTVVVNVKSRSCPGLRRFRVGKTEDVEGFVGKRVAFSIDSSVCKGGAIYRIRTLWRAGGM